MVDKIVNKINTVYREQTGHCQEGEGVGEKSFGSLGLTNANHYIHDA